MLAACGEEESAEPEWWQPAPGETVSWDWQISEPYDLSAPHDMYDLDLFDLAPAGSELRYPNGDVVEVPAGPLAGAVEELHAREPRPVVICYVDTGAYESYRPDAARFPEVVIGNDTGWSEEHWLDIRPASREAFAEIIWARFDLAERMGCDGVEPDQNNPLGNDPGFPITLDDQHSWYREVAEQAHARGLSVGMKNGYDQPGSAAELVDAFDWALPEECAEFDECAELDVFVEQGKAVFAVDYPPAVGESAACREHRAHGFDGLLKDEPPTGAFRTSCGG
ncbi:endo alpha-1,4 polygalactosaminidase [Streptomyces mayteni]